MNGIASLFRLVEIYRNATGLSESRVSTLLFGGGARLSQIREGKDVGTRILDRAFQWFSDRWPEGAEWPADVPRPAPTPAISEAAE